MEGERPGGQFCLWQLWHSSDSAAGSSCWSLLWLCGVGSPSLFLCLYLCLSLFTLTPYSIQTPYLFPVPFPTLLCPPCDPITPLHFPVSLWSGDMCIGAGESSTSACLGMLWPPWSGANTLPCGSHSDQARAYPIWWCKKYTGLNYQRSEVRLQVFVFRRGALLLDLHK